jgi:membrane protein YdbS with pleckstrin-like domain
MPPISLLPSPKLRSKFRLIATITLLLQLLWSLPLGLFIGLDVSGTTGAIVGLLIALALNLLWYLPALWLIDRYVRSIQYEIQEDEIIVRVGIWTYTVKHVPYRTVTNIAVKRDIFDRFLFNIGTLEVQTAGANTSQSGGAEESLLGLVDYEGVYNIVADALRRYRSLPMAPTQAGAEVRLPASATSDAALGDLLQELRAIRTLLAERPS